MLNAYIWLKFIHIVSIAGWLGGFAAIAVLNGLASRRAEVKEVAAFVGYAQALGARLAGPASGIAILSGLAGMLVGRLSMPVWILWGIVAVLLFVAIGVIAMRPTLKRLTEGVEAGATPEHLRRLLRRQRWLLAINLLILLSALWAMVFKPN